MEVVSQRKESRRYPKYLAVAKPQRKSGGRTAVDMIFRYSKMKRVARVYSPTDLRGSGLFKAFPNHG